MKKIVRSVSFEEAKAIADEALTMETGDEIRAMIEAKMAALGIQIL